MGSVRFLEDDSFNSSYGVQATIGRRRYQAPSTLGHSTSAIGAHIRSQQILPGMACLTAMGIFSAVLASVPVQTIPNSKSSVIVANDEFVARKNYLEDRFMRSRSELNELLDLEDGWDGIGSIAPSADTIGTALDFISQVPATVDSPETTVSSDGNVGIYWEQGNSIVSIAFLGQAKFAYFAKKDGVVGARGTAKFNGSIPDDLVSAIVAV